MQGRLSPLVDGRIQAFPWETWVEEFETAEHHQFSLMEWTLDQDRLYENPLLNQSGQKKIRNLCNQHSVSIPSLTGDCFMQAPFWKAQGALYNDLITDFQAVVNACSQVGIEMVVVPLVDNGRLETLDQENILIDFLLSQSEYFKRCGVQIIFESDFFPDELARFIKRLPSDIFGINYDIGNSAALGYSVKEEFAAYGERIVNVHVKDRNFGGTTVELGRGNAHFESVFAEIAHHGYSGNFILQTARATDDTHAETLCRYRDLTLAWLAQAGLLKS